MTEYKHIKRWAMPEHYAGEIWPDYYSSGVGQSRDSSDLEQSNFATMLQRLGGESETVIVVRESHWAVGWVEWIAIHATDESALAMADRLMGQLEDYPVLDESDWSERECESAFQAWSTNGLAYRVEMCCRAGVSIFAARRADELPTDNGVLQSLLLGV